MSFKKTYGFLIAILIFMIVIITVLSNSFHDSLINNVSVYDHINAHFSNFSIATANGFMYIYNYPFIFIAITFIILMAAIMFLEKAEMVRFRLTKVVIVVSFVIIFLYNQYFMDTISNYLNNHGMIQSSPSIYLFKILDNNQIAHYLPEVALFGIISYIIMFFAYAKDLKKKRLAEIRKANLNNTKKLNQKTLNQR